jgi:hypothetical protein
MLPEFTVMRDNVSRRNGSTARLSCAAGSSSEPTEAELSYVGAMVGPYASGRAVTSTRDNPFWPRARFFCRYETNTAGGFLGSKVTQLRGPWGSGPAAARVTPLESLWRVLSICSAEAPPGPASTALNMTYELFSSAHDGRKSYPHDTWSSPGSVCHRLTI